MKHVLVKTILIIMDKLTRNRVLWDIVGLRRVPRGADKAKKNFPSCRVGWG